MFNFMSNFEIHLLRKAVKHYMIHQLGTTHPDLGKYQAMLVEMEKELEVQSPVCDV